MNKSPIEILMLEDDLADADFIQEMLAKSRQPGYSVQHAKSLAEGLRLLGGRSFDVVLVDLGLPDSKGLETALAVQNQTKRTPIIIFTALDDEETALKALQMDIQDYLIKGELTSEQLKRSIRYAIQRKSDHEALRQSEQRFASFMLHLPAAAWIKDLQGRYLYANAEAERIFSLPLSEFSGKRDGEFLPQETAGQFREHDERVLAEGVSLRTTEVLRQADGIEHHSIVSKFPVPGPDGQAAYVAGVSFDITDLVRTEDALRLSEERFRGLLTASSQVLYRMSPDWSEMWQLSSLEFLANTERPSSTWLQDYILPDDQPFVVAVIQQAIRNKSIFELEHRVLRADGSVGWVLSRAVPLMDVNGEIVEWFGAANNITERKQAEEEIKRLNADLTERAAELEELNRDLETFNYTVAHDLRQPLNIVSGYSQAIKEFCGDMLDEQCRRFLQETHDSAMRMNRLIDALLNFSSMARVKMHRETVDLSDMAHGAAEELKLAEPARRVTFRFADGLSAEGDPNLLRLVLSNLFGNAWKYTGTREEAVIEFGVTEIDGNPAYFVRDNGPGFDMADVGKLFVPFQRLPGAEECRGFGIGLATVERIIRRHGGKLWAEGEPGKGATFYFTLSNDQE